jgi:23S rRNA pseudouridine1911/1915/1917 synthase
MHLSATDADAGKRLDHFLQERLPEYSRSRLQQWIKAGRVSVNGAAGKSAHALRGTEQIEVHPAEPPPLSAAPEDLPIDILYEDDDVIAVNKPAGMVVHAGAGQRSGTLTNALVHHFATLSSVGGPLRPGIVHRIDRYSSGVLLVARTDAAHRSLARQFAARTIDKIYLTLVHGRMSSDSGRITAPIVRDPVRRTRMTARLGTGRTALTDYRVLRQYREFAYLRVKIGTGRTHQIRAHFASLGHPVAGDKLYGAPASPFGRYFLHARSIAFDSPSTGERVEVEAPLAAELQTWLDGLII